MEFTKDEISALEAAVATFDDMVEGGSQDDSHPKHHRTLTQLLKKAKQGKKSKTLVATDAQIKAIHSQFADCHAMLGGGEDDSKWIKNINLVNRMFTKNGLPIVE